MLDQPMKTFDVVESVRVGEDGAIDLLADRCYERMIQFARPLVRRLGLRPEIGADDVANHVLHQLCLASRAGAMPRFEDDSGFWEFVSCLILRSLLKARAGSCSLKRGGAGRSRVGLSRRSAAGAEASFHRVDVEADGLPCVEAPTEVIVLGWAEVERFIGTLGDESLRRLVRMRLDGYTLREIAGRTGRDVGTVKRKVRLLRQMWRDWARRR